MDTESARTPLTPVEKAKKGDPIRRQSLLNGVSPGRIVAGFEGAAVGASLSPTFSYYGEDILLLPTYSAGGFVLAAGTYAGLRHLDQRRAAKAEAIQAEIRQAIGEPVDVFASGRGKNRRLNLRWYGADHQTPATILETASRFKTVVDFAEENDISSIALDADWVEAALAQDRQSATKPELSAYGEVTSGDSFISDELRTNVAVVDHESAENVLVSSFEQARELLAAIESSANDLLIGEVIHRSGDTGLIAEYALFKKSEGASYQRLLDHTRSRLEMIINQETSGIQRIRDENWAPVRERVHHNRRINGEFIHQTTEPLAPSSENKSTFEIVSILDLYCARTLNELLTKALREKPSVTQQDDLIAAAYLLAARKDTRQTLGTASLSGKAQHKDTESLFERLPKEPRGISDARRRRARLRNPEAITITYEKRPGFSRVAKTIGIFATAGALVLGAKLGAESLGTPIYDDRKAWCEAEGIEPTELDDVFGNPNLSPEEQAQATSDRFQEYHERCKTAYRGEKPLNQIASDAIDAYYDMEWEIQKNTVSTVLDTFGSGFISAIAPYATGVVSAEWARQAAKEAPESIYTGQLQQSFIGDFDPSENKVIYSVESLDGTSTEGYWYGDSFDRLRSYSGNIHYSRDDNGREASIELDTRDISVLNEENALSVSTPYISFDSQIKLPILNGMSITAIRVIDKEDADKTYTPSGLYSGSETDIKSLVLSREDASNMQAAGINEPVLTYWLSPDDNEEQSDYYSKEMWLPSAADFSLDPNYNAEQIQAEAEQQLTQDVKSAFGLPSTATPDEVVTAIQSKKYSYTPMKDAGLETLSEGKTEGAYGVFRDIGENLGAMDALNCNMASTAFLLATVTEPTGYNQATGYRDDGDGKLTQREAHAWIVDQDNTIIDPTPTDYDEQDKSPEAEMEAEDTQAPIAPILPIAGGVLAGAGAYAAWRKRREIAAYADQHRVRSATQNTHAAKALSVIEHAFYGSPEDTIDWSISTADTMRNYVDRLAMVPQSESRGTPTTIKNALDNPTLSAAQKRAVKKVYNATNAARRVSKR
jgi:hypothetical protein